MNGSNMRSGAKARSRWSFALLMLSGVTVAWYFWLGRMALSMPYSVFYAIPAPQIWKNLIQGSSAPLCWGGVCEVIAFVSCAEIIGMRRTETWVGHMAKAASLWLFANAMVVLVSSQTMMLLERYGSQR